MTRRQLQWLAVGLFVIAFLSPFQGFDWFTPDTSAVFVFGIAFAGKGRVSELTTVTIIRWMNTTKVLPNGEKVVIARETITRTSSNVTVGPQIGNGFVTLTG
jgi:hypothetical protein